MATALIEPATAAAASDPFNVTEEAPVTLTLSGAGAISGRGYATVEYQTSDEDWVPFARLDGANKVLRLVGEMTVRVVKGATSKALGVDRGDEPA